MSSTWMRRRAGVFAMISGAACALACGGSSRTEHPGADSGGSGGAGAAGRPGTGGAAVGGTAGAGGTGEGGEATSGGSAGSAGISGAGGDAGGDAGGAAGTGGRGSVPGETPDESDILRPLGTSDAAIDDAQGEALVELMRAIDFARGYAMCRCFRYPSEAPGDVDELTACARDESGFHAIARQDGARCIVEHADEVPDFTSFLRCHARLLRDDGLDWTEVCSAPGSVPPLPPACERSAAADALILECDSTIYCADQTVASGYRCNATADCEDLSDERSCYDLTGQDQVTCDGEISSPFDFCYSACGAAATPPLCDPERPGRFLCAGGDDVTTDVVCDRSPDCADGTDEAHCLR